MQTSVSPRRKRAAAPEEATSGWWRHDRLRYVDGELRLGDSAASALAREHGSPLDVLDLEVARRAADRLRSAFDAISHPAELYFALKANRSRSLLEAFTAAGVGMDCCSPHEVALAMECGASPRAISFTGTALSDRDVEAIAGLDLRLNLDSISAIHKVGRRFPGRRIGLRVNPQVGVGATEQLTYAGKRPTKFGIYADRFDEALRLAASYGLIVEGVHMHVGSGWLAEGMPSFLDAATRLCDFARRVPDLRYVNVGGGIGVVHGPGQAPVDLDAYARGLSERVRSTLGDVEICVEPGEYLVGPAGVSLAEVTMVEEKGGVLFVGLDVGFNSNPQAAHYAFEHAILPTVEPGPSSGVRPCTVVGNINEAIDVFAHDVLLPPVHEGDVLAILNTGAYARSMASDHCLRERASEVVLDGPVAR